MFSVFAPVLISFLVGFLWVALTAFWPLWLIYLVSVYFGVGLTAFVVKASLFGLFHPWFKFSVKFLLKSLRGFQDDKNPSVVLKRTIEFFETLDRLSIIERVSLTLLMWFFIIVWVARRTVKSSLEILKTVVIYFFVTELFNLLGLGSRLDLFLSIFLPSLWSSVVKFYSVSSQHFSEGKEFRSMALIVLAMRIVNLCYGYSVIVSRFHIKGYMTSKSKIMRSMFAVSVKFIEGVRLPQIFRSPAELGVSQEEAEAINGSVNKWLDWARSIGYPVSEEVVEAEPIEGIAGGVYDPAWLIAGSSWRVHLPQFKAYAQPEFRKFQILTEEYKMSHTYANLDNQLRATARYFYSKDVDFPASEEIVEACWDMLRDIYENSKITPVWAIYKAWNKKFNVGVFTTSEKRNNRAGMKKLPRREWIGKFGPKRIVEIFENFARYGLVYDTYAQFFTKMEWLKPSKWLNDKVRTPIAMALTEFVPQMVVSMEPNKRFRWDTTPIKVGMPMKNGTFETMWKRHARFQKHYAGDCREFDSTIIGGLLEVVKDVRKKGFEHHKDYRAIAKVIDTIYKKIEFSKLVSANSGNIYKKGAGLATGHGSTTPDNSSTTVAMYMAAWVTLTGRSAAEFRYYNELSCYGDDHVLSSSEDAPAIWTWNNIVILLKSWGIEMDEEVPSGGKGVPFEKLMFLRKVPRLPSLELNREFGDVFPGMDKPEFYTLHDRGPLIGKLTAALANKDPRYRVKRIQSFMYLCAHRKDVYDICDGALQDIFNSRPRVAKELAKYTPSYHRVIEVWYTEKIPKDVLDQTGEDVDPEMEILPDAITFYGEYGPFEALLSMLSKIPDLVTPALRNAGPLEFIMLRYRDFLSWPKALIARANNCASKGHLEAFLSNTCYDWITKNVPWTNKTGYTTLIVRHWVYLLVSEKNPTSFAFMVTGFFKNLISLNFMVNGFVAPNRPKYAISYWNFALTIFLNFLEVDEMPFLNGILLSLKMPDLVGFTDDIVSSIWTWVCHNLFPASFADTKIVVSHQLREGGYKRAIISAPTGSGKSTDMIYSLYVDFIVSSPMKRRLFVVVPRVALAKGLARYLSGKFAWDVGFMTGEGDSNKDADVIFITTGSFIARHSAFFNKGFLFVHDEFHLNEVETFIVRQLFASAPEENVLFASATPLSLSDVPVIPVVVNRSYSYEVEEASLPKAVPYGLSYRNYVLSISRATNPWMVHLVFVDSFTELDSLAEILPNSVGEISSRRHDVSDKKWILATSSADVGVTIPNVDVVVTKSFQYGPGPKGMSIYRHSQALITQRSGRTGRTNNGFVYILNPPEGLDIHNSFDSVLALDVISVSVKASIPPSSTALRALQIDLGNPIDALIYRDHYRDGVEILDSCEHMAIYKMLVHITRDAVSKTSGPEMAQARAMFLDMLSDYFKVVELRDLDVMNRRYFLNLPEEFKVLMGYNPFFFSFNWKYFISPELENIIYGHHNISGKLTTSVIHFSNIVSCVYI